MEFKELQNKTVADLHKLLAELRHKLQELRFKVANNQLKNIREVRDMRKTVARVMMLVGQKKSADAPRTNAKS